MSMNALETQNASRSTLAPKDFRSLLLQQPDDPASNRHKKLTAHRQSPDMFGKIGSGTHDAKIHKPNGARMEPSDSPTSAGAKNTPKSR